MLTRRPMMALLAIVVMLLASVFVTPTYAHSFIRRRATHPGPPRIVERSSPNPDRTTHYVSRSAPRLEDAITPAAMRKREPKAVSQAGGLALPLNLRARKAESSGHLQTRSRIPTSKTSYSEEYIKGMLDVTPHVGKNGGSGNGQKWSSNDDSGGGGGGGGVPPPAQIPLDYDIELNVTLDGIPTQLTVSGDEVIAPGSANTYNPFTAPDSSNTGLKWKDLAFGGDVHKGDLVFADGQYTLPGIAYGSRDEDGSRYAGQLGIGIPSRRIFPQDAPPSLSQALTDTYGLTNYSIAAYDEYTLLLGQDPWIEKDPKAFAGSVTPEGNYWTAKCTINGTAFEADFSIVNQQIYGDADAIQAFFGDQQPTTRNGSESAQYYDVPCSGGPPIEFQLGDENGGLHTILYDDATVYADKESSTGCTSVLVGVPFDPERYATAWTLGNAFQYHYTPQFSWADPQNPVINFYGRPNSEYK